MDDELKKDQFISGLRPPSLRLKFDSAKTTTRHKSTNPKYPNNEQLNEQSKHNNGVMMRTIALAVLIISCIAHSTQVYLIPSNSAHLNILNNGYDGYLALRDDSTYVFSRFDRNIAGKLAAVISVDSGIWKAEPDSISMNSTKCSMQFNKCTPKVYRLAFKDGKVSSSNATLLSQEQAAEPLARMQSPFKELNNSKNLTTTIIAASAVGALAILLIMGI